MNFKFYLLVLPVLLVSFFTLFLLSGEISPVSADPLPKVWVCKYSGTPGVNEFLKPGKQPIDVNANSTGGATVGNSFADAQGRSYVLALKTDENTGSGNSYIGDEKCLEGDIPTPININPIFECWESDPENEGNYIAYFGWENKSDTEQTLPYGEYNSITPSSYQSYFPTHFNIPTNGPRPGRTPFYPNAAIEISNWDGENIVWKLTDQGTATAGLTGPRCPEPEPEPSWIISKSVVKSCVEGDDGEMYAKGVYTIHLENVGNAKGYISEVVDELDSKVIEDYLYLISDDGNYSESEGEISWNSGEHGWFEPEDSKEFTYELHIPESAYGTYDNTVKAYSSLFQALALRVTSLEKSPVATDSVSAELVCQIYEPTYCEATIDGNTVWSEWVADPSDDTQEMRTGVVSLWDAEDNTHDCGTREITEYRDIEDTGDVLGTTDEKETGEVLGTTTIVSANTAGGSVNPMIALIEYVLIILTGISFVYIGKKQFKI